jgi:hypothetical protein
VTLAALSTLNTPAQNTAAFVAALPDVELPDGAYDLDPVALVSGARVRGAGKRRTVLRLADRTIHNDPAFGGLLNLHAVADVVLEDFTVDGNAVGQTLTGTTESLNIECLSFQNAERCHVYRVRAINAVSDGFDYDDSVDCTTEDCEQDSCGGFGIHCSLRSRFLVHTRAVARVCGFTHSRGGFDAHGTSPNQATDCTYVACRAEGCYRGFLLGGDRNVAVACRDEASVNNGMRITGEDNTVSACKFVGTTVGNGITVDAGSRNVLMGNTARDAAGHGVVLVTGSLNNALIGNQSHANAGRGVQLNAGANTNAVVGSSCTGNPGGNTVGNSGSGNALSANV